MRFGAMCDIEEQCNAEGYTLGDKKELVDKLHFGLVINHIYGLLTEKEYDSALRKLNKLIGKYAVRIEK